MTRDRTTGHRTAHRAARLATAASAVTLAASAWTLVSTDLAAAAPVNAGGAQISMPAGTPTAGQPLDQGGSATSFTLKLPAGAKCGADGINGGRWHTFMVPGTEDPAAVAFAGNGALVGQSTGSGGTGTFRQNLYTTAGNPIRGQAPNVGDAAVINIPNMRFSVWGSGQIPPGLYTIGISCIDLDVASAVDNYWTSQMNFVADATDPVGVRWVAVAAQTPTSSTTSSSSTSSSTTSSSTTSSSTTSSSTTSSSTTSSTSSTTSPPAASTVSGSVSGAATVGQSSAGTASAGTAGSSDTLPRTGSTWAVLVVSAFLLVVFGRIALLLGRSVRIDIGPGR